jgi:hypothetical protein
MSDKNDNELGSPLVEDEEFVKLMSAAENAKFSAKDLEMMARVEDRLLTSAYANDTKTKSSAKFGWTLEDLKGVSFKRFLAVAAVVSLFAGVSVSLLMTPDEEYEGVKGEETVALPVEMTIRFSESSDAILDSAVKPGEKLKVEVYSDKSAYYSLIVFRNGARSVTTAGQEIEAGMEVVVSGPGQDPLVIEAENPYDEYDVCVIAADTQSRLRSLINTYATHEATTTAAKCEKFKVSVP